MGKTAWTAVGVLGLACMVVMAAAAAIMGGCSTVLETTAGGTCFMKCHWTFVAVPFAGVAGAVAGLLALLAAEKQSRRFPAAMVLVCAVVAVVLTTDFGIGLCGGADMHCHATALVVRVLAVAAGAVSVVQMAKADPAEASKPKMQL